MKVVLAGASGLIGPALAASLGRDGHEVVRLVRRTPSGPGDVAWDPSAGELDPRVLADADAVVCLSGVGVGDKRWNEAYKQQIVASRVDSVATIARAMVASGTAATLVGASAVGYYGDTGAREVDETAPAGDTFLAGVCQLWEDAAAPAAEAELRVVHLRTGLVLARGAGLLRQLGLVVKAGLGGRLGDGRQYMPWISLTDEIAAIRYLLDHDVSGPVNLTAPTPVTNAEFTRTLGRVLHRPTPWLVPGFAARLALGEFAENVLTGQNAVPAALLAAGYRFTHTDLEVALHDELNR
ncbi:hypothetical protein SAMN05443575_2297 [Jatrophihabitans endophyticus]|uniref:TIGR01777 family protein n=1 Tax=Jatrophihabitans endophyticus TaxID=1206085 RepID=A0A1M5KYJ2_9ACTN|nr:TIGR01777 family oxidoreductase [Jatrophihabitans endophyticus]SHG57785.1 hypothetical protein SAMN05443575_2297 [Jatrophihabitans endophyticus]